MTPSPLLARALLATVLVGALSLVPAVTATADPIDTDDRGEVTEAYRAFQHALDTTLTWSGSRSGCKAGSVNSAGQAATLEAINVARGLAGLDDVRFDTALSAKAQKAALVMHAENSLSHSIDSSWSCYSSDAKKAAASSNLAIGASGAGAIAMYLDDPGSSNAVVGHRRWILLPEATTMGSGSTRNTNALWVFGARSDGQADPKWVRWPAAGYFPTQLEPSGRWSLSGDSAFRYDFSKAKVTVTDVQGNSYKTTVHPAQQGYGNDTLVWQVKSLYYPKGTNTKTYTVKVTGIKRDGKSMSHSYTVRLFNPLAG